MRKHAGSVHAVADHGVAELGKMDADLVRSTSLEPAGQKSCDGAEPLDNTEVGDGLPTQSGLASDAAPQVCAFSDEGETNGAGLAIHLALDHGQILPLDVVRLEQSLKSPLCCVRAGKNERSRGFFIEPMDHAQEGTSPITQPQEAARAG